MAPIKRFNLRKRNKYSFRLEVNNYLRKISWVSRSVSDNRAFNKDFVEVINKPYKVFKLKKFIGYGSKAIANEIMNMEYTLKDSDLFSVYQSKDFLSFPPESTIFAIREFFNTEVRRVVEALFKKELDGDLSISASKYDKTRHLLCHDDKVGDRDVAFIYYCNHKWDINNGGLFEMFAHDQQLCFVDQVKFREKLSTLVCLGDFLPSEVVTTICPSFNLFICFEVTPTSFHQVSEVLATRPEARYAISGWFHSTKAVRLSLNLGRHLNKLGQFRTRLPLVLSNVHDINDLLASNRQAYLSKADYYSMRLVMNHFVEFPVFIKPYLHNDIADELRGDSISWIRSGPAIIRSVEVAELDYEENGCPTFFSEYPALSAFLDMIQTSVFLNFLGELFGYPFNQNNYSCEFEFEINRWSWKTYTLAQELSAIEYGPPGLDLIKLELWFFFNCTDNRKTEGSTGVIFNFNEDDGYIVPVDNTLVVFKSSRENEQKRGCPYLKYVNCDLKDSPFYSIRAWYYIKCNPGLINQRD